MACHQMFNTSLQQFNVSSYMEYYHQCNDYIKDIRYKEFTKFSLIGSTNYAGYAHAYKNSNIQGR